MFYKQSGNTSSITRKKKDFHLNYLFERESLLSFELTLKFFIKNSKII